MVADRCVQTSKEASVVPFTSNASDSYLIHSPVHPKWLKLRGWIDRMANYLCFLDFIDRNLWIAVPISILILCLRELGWFRLGLGRFENHECNRRDSNSYSSGYQYVSQSADRCW